MPVSHLLSFVKICYNQEKQMHLHPRHNRQDVRLFSEARLCYDGPTSGPLENASATAFNWTRDVGRFFGGIGEGVIDGFKRAFGENPNPAQREQMRRAVEFLRTAPSEVTALVNERIISARPRLAPEMIADYTNHTKWLDALGDWNKADAAINSGSGINNPVLALVRRRSTGEARSAAEVQQLYAGYVRTFVPEQVQSRFRAPGEPFNDTNTAANRETILKAMRAMTGGESVDAASPEGKIAIQSLSRYYFETDPDGTIPADRNNKRKTSVSEDFLKVLQDYPSLSPTVEGMRDAIPSGFFKGALKLGVITNADLADLNKPGGVIEKMRSERLRKTHEVGTKLDAYMGATRLEAQRGAEGLSDRFRNMPLLAKILLVFGLWRFGSRNQPAAMGIGAVMFGMYFFGRRDRPLDDAGQFIAGIAGLGSGTFDSARGMLGMPADGRNLSARDIDRRAQAYTQFLSEHTRSEMSAAVSLGVVGDVSMSTIMRNFDPDNATNERGFRFHDAGFRQATRTALAGRGLSESALTRAFGSDENETSLTLEQRTNRAGMRTALRDICFFVASRNPNNAADVEIVQLARRGLREGQGSYENLPTSFRDPRTGRECNPRQIWQSLIMRGHAEAKDDSTSLGEYVFGVVGAATPEQQRKEKTDKATAEGIRKNAEVRGKEIIDHVMSVSGVRMEVTFDAAGKVIYGIPEVAGGIPRTLKRDLTIAQFRDKNRDTLLDEWKIFVMSNENKEYMREGLPIGEPLSPLLAALPLDDYRRFVLTAFEIETDGEYIRYCNTPPVVGATANEITGRSSIYKFWSMPRNEIHSRYLAWRRRAEGYRTAAATKDPLERDPRLP